MTFIKKLISVLLSISLLISAFFIQFSFNVIAASQKGVVININDALNIRSQPSKSGSKLGKIYNGYNVIVNSETTGDTVTDNEINGSPSSNKWYNITYNGITGYVSSLYISIIPEYVQDNTFEDQISTFPDSYKPYLRELHVQYPNWRFTPENINLTFDEAVELQLTQKLTSGNVSWRSMGVGGYDWSSDTWVQPESGWYRASREVIKYYVDPRSYLNSSSIFAFLPHDQFDANTQTESRLNKIINGTFLAQNFGVANDYGGSYSRILTEAGRYNNLNMYVLAGIIIQEQGKNGTSPIISGTYSGYENLYNFFNIRATGSTKDQIYVNGLSYAREKGWSTRSASIIGGAKFCAEKYIYANQNTYYYMNFNVKNPTTEIWHQYATAIHDSNSKGANVSKAYIENKQDIVNFLIPVYKNTPDEVTQKPAENDKLNNYYITNLSVTTPGTASNIPSFDMYKNTYDLNVWDNTTLKVDTHSGAYYVGAKSFSLGLGQNSIVLTVKSQSGYLNDYTINIKADKACTLTIDAPSAPSYMRGDTNGDGIINGRDLANIQMDILEVKKLTGDARTFADTNGDGKINGRDLADVQMDILGVRKLN